MAHDEPGPALPGTCGAQRRKKPGTHCRNQAGKRTNHPGQGKCYLHGGASPIKHGRYSTITHGRIGALMNHLAETDRNVLDLEPEAHLLRAMVIDYINRYETFVDELHTWAEATQRARGKGAPPPKLEILAIHDASDLVERVSRVVEKMHRIQRESALSMETFRRVMEEMGLVVTRYVSDPHLLAQIETGWRSVIIDAKALASGPAQADEDAPSPATYRDLS